MPLYFPVIICTVFLSSCHVLILSLDPSSLVSLFELSFSYSQDVLIWCARFLTYTDYHTYLYAWHTT